MKRLLLLGFFLLFLGCAQNTGQRGTSEINESATAYANQTRTGNASGIIETGSGNENLIETVETEANCEEIGDMLKKDECYYGLAISRNAISLCEKIQYPYTKDDCYSALAAKNKNIAICDEKISGEYERQLCYAGVAAETGNIAICDKITEKGLKYPCYTAVANATKNKKICDRIDNDFWKESCYSNIGA